MAYNIISQTLWNSEKFNSLNSDYFSKLLYLYLLNNSHSNSCGCYVIKVGYIMIDLDCDNEQAMRGLSELSKLSLVYYNEKENLVLIPKFLDHNPPNNPKHSIKVFADTLSIPFHDFKVDCMWQLQRVMKEKNWTLPDEKQEILDTLSIPYPTLTHITLLYSTQHNTTVKKNISIDISQKNECEKMAVEIYNEMAEQKNIPKCQKLSEPRKAKLKARLKDCGGIDGWETACNKIKNSSFLTGQNEKGWTAKFDWIIKQENFIKIMEGNYDDREKQNGSADSELELFLGRSRN